MTQGPDDSDRDIPDLVEGAPTGGKRRPGLGTFIRIGFLVITVAFAAWAVVKNWNQLEEAWRRVQFGPIAVAFVLYLAGTLAAYPAWREILAGLGSRLPTVKGARVFLLGQLGKYVPGGVWSILAQISLARELHVPRTRSGTAGVLSILIGLITAGFISAITLAISGRALLGEYAWVLILATPIIALLNPSVLSWTAKVVSRVTRRTVFIERIPTRQLLLASAIQAVGNVLLGVQFYFVVGTVSGTWLPILLAIGLFNLAAAAGVLVPIAPAGVGVREVILIAGLSPFSGSSMDSGAALLIVLMSRVLSIIADFGLAGAVGIGMAIGTRTHPAPRSVP